MTILKHRKHPNGSFLLRVHLDETKTVDGGQPDPEWVREFEWAPKPDSMTQADYVTQQKRETRLLCQLALDEMNATAGTGGTAVPGSEGTTL